MLTDLQIYDSIIHDSLMNATDIFYTTLGTSLQASV